jgi:hypothetical protein
MTTQSERSTHLLLLELGPVLLVVDHEALGGLWVTHLVVCGGCMCVGVLSKRIAGSSQR